MIEGSYRASLRGEVMSEDIQIVNRERGLQVWTSRVTVLDLVPYFQEGCSYDEIIHWIPTLTHEEIAVVERYYREHKDEMDEKDRCAQEQSAQRRNPPWVEKIADEARAERLARLQQMHADKPNGAGK